MKTTDFLKEGHCAIADEAETMHKDHEVQMARSQLYATAQAAIEIHRMLKGMSEMEGLEGWVQSKITLAADYLNKVRDYLQYEQASQAQEEMMNFVYEEADYAFDKLVNETASVGGTGAGAVATSMGGGNGFANGGPGTLKRVKEYKNSAKKAFTKGKGVY